MICLRMEKRITTSRDLRGTVVWNSETFTEEGVLEGGSLGVAITKLNRLVVKS